jgi:hypothetical protein
VLLSYFIQDHLFTPSRCSRIEVVEAYLVDTVVRERPCRQVMASHRTGTIGSKSGTFIPCLPHFQGFIEQEGKGREEVGISIHCRRRTQ